MSIVDLKQGSDEWHKFRSSHFGASEASAMLGLSPYKSRTELLDEKCTGLSKEIDAFTQSIFDNGHKVEDMARPIIESMIGEDLYPVTLEDGKLSASCDGLTIDGSIAWECKQYNDSLFKSVINNKIPEHHWPQCQQVLMLSNAEKLIFTCSDGTQENTASMDVHPDKELFDRLLQGWAQFYEDSKNHTPSEKTHKPFPEAVMQLPSIIYKLDGLAVISNLDEYRTKAFSLVEESKTPLKSDQDFANAENMIKAFADAESMIKLMQKRVFGEFTNINRFNDELQFIYDSIRTARLNREKQVSSRKESIKLEILNSGKTEWNDFLSPLSESIKPILLMVSTPDFAGSMKGKRNIDSLKDSIFTEISRKKIDASKIAIDVRTKLDFFNSIEDQYKPLFSDLQYIIYKPLDDFKLAIQSRIDAYTTVDRVIITQEKTEQILVVRNEEQSREMEIKWRDAQKEIPENFQVCVVIGETKTTDTISPYIALYSEHNDTFQNMATHKIFVPRKKARWWFPLETPNHPHPMDV